MMRNANLLSHPNAKCRLVDAYIEMRFKIKALEKHVSLQALSENMFTFPNIPLKSMSETIGLSYS
jgi:hypothetical protein